MPAAFISPPHPVFTIFSYLAYSGTGLGALLMRNSPSLNSIVKSNHILPAFDTSWCLKHLCSFGNPLPSSCSLLNLHHEISCPLCCVLGCYQYPFPIEIFHSFDLLLLVQILLLFLSFGDLVWSRSSCQSTG